MAGGAGTTPTPSASASSCPAASPAALTPQASAPARPAPQHLGAVAPATKKPEATPGEAEVPPPPTAQGCRQRALPQAPPLPSSGREGWKGLARTHPLRRRPGGLVLGPRGGRAAGWRGGEVGRVAPRPGRLRPALPGRPRECQRSRLTLTPSLCLFPLPRSSVSS
uniref:Uncharacterized protein n=1 Tax=Rousettus aegyptiacus TaxID=9407 RepID=A0A7J8FIT1_ROUAE|nr:hypothetical protein HJG63_012057 [Rousettus aegyptiacus]